VCELSVQNSHPWTIWLRIVRRDWEIGRPRFSLMR
jgi:hypothetical protein